MVPSSFAPMNKAIRETCCLFSLHKDSNSVVLTYTRYNATNIIFAWIIYYRNTPRTLRTCCAVPVRQADANASNGSAWAEPREVVTIRRPHFPGRSRARASWMACGPAARDRIAEDDYNYSVNSQLVIHREPEAVIRARLLVFFRTVTTVNTSPVTKYNGNNNQLSRKVSRLCPYPASAPKGHR